MKQTVPKKKKRTVMSNNDASGLIFLSHKKNNPIILPFIYYAQLQFQAKRATFD
jgi:hypothetical protein